MGAIAPAEVARRADALGRRVLAPLVLGGTVKLVRPIGAALAIELAGGERALEDLDLASRVDVARVRQARLLAPVDTLPRPGSEEWALVAALNDLLQATNHELSGPLTRARHARLLASVIDLCGRVAPPRTVGEALARHATFARSLDLVRTDTRVAWWTGTATFRGQAPPGRLLAWPELRRVQVEPRPVGLADMADGLPVEAALAYGDALAAWLARSPLTDLAAAARVRPAFGWTAATLSLVSIPLGRTLALRATARQPRADVLAALGRATEELERAGGAQAAMAKAFVAELAARPADAA